MLRIVFSHRFEDLRERLLDGLAEAPAGVFEPQQVVVPSAGMRKAVELAHADRFGIAANIEFDYLANWLWKRMAAFVAVPEASPFAPSSLTWRILRALEDESLCAAHPRLKTFTQKAEPIARFQLAARLAGLFDQYLTYRPEWIRRWSDASAGTTPAHADAPWQAALWRWLAGDLGAGAARPVEAFFAATDARAAAPGKPLPARAHVFCPPTIPPVYVEVLERLARWCDISLYALNPCREYWTDIVDARRLAYLQADPKRAVKAEHAVVGHRLLSAWGNQTRAFLGVLIDRTSGSVELDDALFAHDAFPDTALGRLQRSIFALEDLPPGQSPVVAGDRSIQVHACHSLMRQLEVLHDQLLALFAAPGGLRPCDVLVALPDLAGAAPVVDAVFGTAPEARRIPYTITGRPRTLANPVARALADLLAVARSRWAASEVFGLLRHPCIARRFEFDAAELDMLERWLRRAGIRWGCDAADRQASGLPASNRNSFADGLERLFLGYAMPTPEHTLAGTLPYDDIEGSDAWVLGRFFAFVEALRELRARLSGAKDCGQWSAVFHGALDGFLATDAGEQADLDDVRRDLRALIGEMRSAGSAFPVAADVAVAALAEAMDAAARGGTPSGYVTFAALPSLRGLPYRVVCLLGLDDQTFPAVARPPEFDLMASRPAPGDRQRRDDDRNLFLDYVMGARERLYLSYTGRDLRDNAGLQPSIVVAELLDYLVDAAVGEGAPENVRMHAREHWLIEHPLQPFSESYFRRSGNEAGPLFSYVTEYRDALAAQKRQAAAAMPAGGVGDEDEDGDAGERTAATVFFDRPLAAPGREWRDVGIDQLRRFYANPCRALLEQRLGMRLPEAEDALCDEEPFAIEPLVRIALAERFLPALLGERPPGAAALLELACASPEAPWGNYGRVLLELEIAGLSKFAADIRRIADAEPARAPEPVSLALDVDGERWQLAGALSNLRSSGQLRYRPVATKARDYLFGWLDHLLLCAALPNGVAPVTQWLSTDGKFEFAPVENAREHLATLLRGYRLGLASPLHFYPKSAWARILAKDPAKTWRVTQQNPYGEEGDPYYRLALRGVADPLDGEFEAWAAAVFGPLHEHLRDSRLKA